MFHALNCESDDSDDSNDYRNSKTQKKFDRDVLVITDSQKNPFLTAGRCDKNGRVYRRFHYSGTAPITIQADNQVAITADDTNLVTIKLETPRKYHQFSRFMITFRGFIDYLPRNIYELNINFSHDDYRNMYANKRGVVSSKRKDYDVESKPWDLQDFTISRLITNVAVRFRNIRYYEGPLVDDVANVHEAVITGKYKSYYGMLCDYIWFIDLRKIRKIKILCNIYTKMKLRPIEAKLPYRPSVEIDTSRLQKFSGTINQHCPVLEELSCQDSDISNNNVPEINLANFPKLRKITINANLDLVRRLTQLPLEIEVIMDSDDEYVEAFEIACLGNPKSFNVYYVWSSSPEPPLPIRPELIDLSWFDTENQQIQAHRRCSIIKANLGRTLPPVLANIILEYSQNYV